MSSPRPESPARKSTYELPTPSEGFAIGPPERQTPADTLMSAQASMQCDAAAAKGPMSAATAEMATGIGRGTFGSARTWVEMCT